MPDRGGRALDNVIFTESTNQNQRKRLYKKKESYNNPNSNFKSNFKSKSKSRYSNNNRGK